MKRWLGLIAVFGLAGCDLDISDLAGCDYSREYTQRLDASFIGELLVDSQEGDLFVEGEAGSNEVRVHARACANDSRTLSDIDFELSRVSGRAELTTYVPAYDRSRLDLTIEVPRDFDVEIYDSSGDIDVRNVHDLVVQRRGRGSLRYSNISGVVLTP
jgi:hypothetical protein